MKENEISVVSKRKRCKACVPSPLVDGEKSSGERGGDGERKGKGKGSKGKLEKERKRGKRVEATVPAFISTNKT